MILEQEKWKAVKGFEGVYDVSSLGRVRSLDRIVSGDKRSFKKKGKILNPSVDSKGYFYFKIRDAGKKREERRNVRVHRLVMEAFCGASKEVVDHVNGDKKDNRLSNLKYVTMRENTYKDLSKKEDNYIYLDKRKNFYSVYIKINNKKFYVGGSVDKEKARKKRDLFLSENRDIRVREDRIGNKRIR